MIISNENHSCFPKIAHSSETCSCAHKSEAYQTFDSNSRCFISFLLSSHLRQRKSSRISMHILLVNYPSKICNQNSTHRSLPSQNKCSCQFDWESFQFSNSKKYRLLRLPKLLHMIV